MRLARWSWVAAAMLLPLAGTAGAAETDQFLLWGVELEDSADHVNKWLNDELDSFLAGINSDRHHQNDSADQLAIAFLRHVFSVRPFAHVNELYNSDRLDEYPPREDVNFLEYQRMSVYRKPAFPFVLFMARTIRIGDVYLGLDKLSHLFGFGRRYFVDYLKLESKGLEHEPIVKRLIQQGMRRELWLTGRVINGVISRADLEANFQGLRFALSLCRGPHPVLAKREGAWTRTRPIDIRPYITPHMDESYYQNQYWAARKRQVLPVIATEYAPRADNPAVRARFSIYDTYTPSFNVRYVEKLTRDETGPADERVSTLGARGALR